jgi:hypothetical protein
MISYFTIGVDGVYIWGLFLLAIIIVVLAIKVLFQIPWDKAFKYTRGLVALFMATFLAWLLIKNL